jgi:hypothetical protein
MSFENTLLAWVKSSHVSEATAASETTLTKTSGAPEIYDGVAYAQFPGSSTTTPSGYAVTVKFNDAGYAFAGLTRTMTATDPVSQYVSNIEAGFKNDAGTVLRTYNGADGGVALGSSTSTYKILYDGVKYVYLADGNVVWVDNVIGSSSLAGYNAGVAIFSPNSSVSVTGQVYTGGEYPTPNVEVDAVSNIQVDTSIPEKARVSWAYSQTAGKSPAVSFNVKIYYFSGFHIEELLVETTIADANATSHEFTITTALDITKVEIISRSTYMYGNNTSITSLAGPWSVSAAPTPTITNVSVTQPTTVGVQWTNSVDPESFNLYVYDSSGETYVTYIVSDPTSRSYEIDIVDYGTYSFQTEAVYATGTTKSSNVYSGVSVDGNTVASPEITNAVAGDGSITVDWSYTGTTAISFNIYWTKAGNTYQVLGLDSALRTYTITGLSTGSYAIQLGAVDSQSNEQSSNLFGPVSVQGGGGGGGGGGGNNGGNEHNNMATLTFNPAFTVDATDATDVTIYGEEAVPRPDYTDTLAVSVPLADLNNVLSFTKDGVTAASDFSIDLSGIAAAVKTELQTRLQLDHARPSLADMGIDARSILSVTDGAWGADDAALKVADTTDAARNVYEQAADKGKLSASEGKLNLAVGDTFVFFMDTAATQSVTITIDSGTYSGAATSDVAPLIPLAALFGASNAAGDKGTISKTWDYKFTVTVTATA